MSTVSPAAAATSASDRSLRLTRLSDELLARYAARGSERAVTVLYERYHQPLYRYCRSIVRNDADAQDALQSTFASALDALKRGARNAPLRPWLYRIAHNESVSLLRRRKRDAQHLPASESMTLGASAEEEAAGRARWQRVVEDLAQLPDRQRGALLLRELAGLSHEEIAVALGLTVGGAKQAIFEARQALTEVEEGRLMGCEEVRRRLSEGDRRVLRGRRVRAHLRECATCEAFALAIPSRQSDLRALAPGLPPAAAAAMLGRIIRGASSHGGASATAGSAATAGAAGKAAGTVFAWKALTGAALVATAAAGVTGLTHVLHHRAAARPSPAEHRAQDARLVVGRAVGREATAHHPTAARSSVLRSRGGASSPANTSARHHQTAAAAPSVTTPAAHHPPAGAGHRSGSAPGHSSGSRSARGTAPPRRSVSHRRTGHTTPGRGHGSHKKLQRHRSGSISGSSGHSTVSLHVQLHTPSNLKVPAKSNTP